MTIEDLKSEITGWKLTKYKVINFAIAMAALLILEFVARTYYRPYIYANNINDFHIADTLGNTLGTIAAVFMLAFLFSREKERGSQFIKIGILVLVVYEIGQPLLGKPIDPWDILATVVTGALCYAGHNYIFRARGDSRNSGR